MLNWKELNQKLIENFIKIDEGLYQWKIESVNHHNWYLSCIYKPERVKKPKFSHFDLSVFWLDPYSDQWAQKTKI